MPLAAYQAPAHLSINASDYRAGTGDLDRYLDHPISQIQPFREMRYSRHLGLPTRLIAFC